MKLKTELYSNQLGRWPNTGNHILAQFDDRSVVVYQAYKPTIAKFASEHGYFGGTFSLDRMSWIKTNFLWMMYRSNWGTSFNQEAVLAIWLKREAFEQILSEAVHSSFNAELYGSQENWGTALHRSNVRLQWDPDHGPFGNKQERRAIQLGMKGDTLRLFAREWILKIEDISPFVAEQHALVKAKQLKQLVTPCEDVFEISNKGLAQRICISEWNRARAQTNEDCND